MDMREVLILDDNPKIADYIYRSIDWNKLNCHVIDVFYSPVLALELLKIKKVDIVITDVKMPEISGIELSKKILEKMPLSKIILISGFAEIHDVQEAIRFGAYDFIEKPISIDYLQKIVEKAVKRLEEEEEINKQLLERKSMLLDSFFERLLERPTDMEEIKNYSSYFNININCESYLCIYFLYIDDQHKIENFDLEKRQKELIKLENRIVKLFPSQELLYCVNKLSSVTLIIGMNDNIVNKGTLLSQIAAFLDIPENETIVVGIGKAVNMIGKLYYSFESAKDAIEYRFIYPTEKVFDFQSLNNNKETDFYVGNQSEYLISYIYKNEKDKIKLFIRTYYYDFAHNNANRIAIILAIIDTGRNLIEFAKKTGCSDELIIKQIPQIEKSSTLDDFISWLEDISVQICDLFNTDIQSYHKMIAAKVDDYISNNFHKSELRISDIADYVGVTSNYLSSLYKKITGNNITDAIIDKRISIAREKLIHSNRPIKEICEEVGFSNQYYFSTSFKKMTNMTPSEYRQLNN